MKWDSEQLNPRFYKARTSENNIGTLPDRRLKAYWTKKVLVKTFDLNVWFEMDSYDAIKEDA